MRNILLSVLLTFSTLAQASAYQKVVFTEIMADPEPVVGMPSAEYLEVYNRSGGEVHLAGCALNYGGKIYPLPSAVLPAGEYAVLCSASSASDYKNVRVIPMGAFPSLINTGRLITLSGAGQTMAWLDYSDQWYGSAFKSNGGWSLECVDPDNLSGDASNWKASVDPKGGTPGLKNSVADFNPDVASLVLQKLTVDKPGEIGLYFNRFMDPLLLKNTQFNLRPFKTLVVKVAANAVDQREIRLGLSDTLIAGEQYDLQLNSLCDISGKVLNDTMVSLGLPEVPSAGEFLFNELLFNPKPEGADYVELVSVADRCIDLSAIRLCRRLEDGSLGPSCVLTPDHIPVLPQTHWLITTSPEAVYRAGPFPRAPDVLRVHELPAMPDDSGNLLLTNASGQVLDSVYYTRSMHFALVQDAEGVSLEKRHPDAASEKAENWTSASSLSHFGTPGFVNSHSQPLINNAQEGFSVGKNWCTPDNDGADDAIDIAYRFQKPVTGRLSVFSIAGQLVKRLTGYELFGNQGVLRWDGSSDAGALVPPGRYILDAEVHGDAGLIQKKIALTVLF